MSSAIAESTAIELLRTVANDGKLYAIVPCEWTLEKVAFYWARYEQFEVFSDEVPHTQEGFEKYILATGAVWFEIICLDDRAIVGLMYITDLVLSGTANIFVSAVWHCILFDAKAAPRRKMLKEAIAALFMAFGFRRLQCEIPCRYGGAIKVATKLGFVPEGRLRQARQIGGVMWDVLVLGLLRSEVEA